MASARLRLGPTNIWQQDAFGPSLHFKKMEADLWSVRVGIHQRAIGKIHGDRLVWIWIGTHADEGSLPE